MWRRFGLTLRHGCGGGEVPKIRTKVLPPKHRLEQAQAPPQYDRLRLMKWLMRGASTAIEPSIGFGLIGGHMGPIRSGLSWKTVDVTDRERTRRAPSSACGTQLDPLDFGGT